MCIEAHDRAALERLLRGTALAHPLLWIGCAKHNSEPASDKRGIKAHELTLTPLELIDRIAALAAKCA